MPRTRSASAVGNGTAFVGRDDELAAATAVLDRDGGPTAVLVTGAAGIGKTRLLTEVADRAQHQGWHIERTAGIATGHRMPLAPFLYLQNSAAPPPQTPAEQLLRLRAELRSRAGEQPLLFVIDDAHLLDAGSVMFVHQLITRDPTVVVLAARQGESIDPDLLTLTKERRARRVDLEPLPRGECDVLVTAMLDPHVDRTLLDEVWRVSRGNPLFVRELLGAAREHGVLVRNGRWMLLGSLSPSPLLSEMIGQRLERLAEDPRRVLEAFAVAGPLRWAVVERLTSLETIAELEAARLVCPSPDAAAVDVAHPLHTEVTIERTPTARLHGARRRVADALLASEPLGPAELVRAAALRLDSGIADSDLLVRAARVALDQFDPRQALRFTRATCENADPTPDLRLLYACALSAAGETTDAEREFLLLAELDLGDEWLTRVTGQHAQHRAFVAGDVTAAIGLLRERIGCVPPGSDAPLRGLLSYLAFFAARFDDALDAALPLVAMDPPQIDACQGVGTVWAIRGEPTQVLALWTRAIAGLRDAPAVVLSSQQGVLNLVFVRLLALWQLGRAREGDDPLSVVPREIALPQVHTEVNRLGMDAAQAFHRGHLDDAATKYERLGDRLLQVAPQAFIHNRTVRATVAAMRGDAATARELLVDVDSTPPAQRAGFAFWIGRAGVWIAAAEGDVDAAIAASLELVDRHAGEKFHATIGLHDVVRLDRSDLVVNRLAQQAARTGATWWDRVCADHARALDANDGAAMIDIAARFEAGGLDLHCAEALAQAIRAAGTGALCATASARLTTLLDRCGRARTPTLAAIPPLLTAREHEVARLAAAGLSNREIAQRLGTSARTVGNQLQNAYEKLGVHSRQGLGVLLDRSIG